MSNGTTGEAEVIRLRQGIETQMRRRILEAIELEEGTSSGRSEERKEPRPGHGTR